MESGDRWERAMLAASAIVPAAAGMLHAGNAPDAGHDGAVIRVLGLGGDGVLHALDAWVAAPFLLLPVGTAAYRAAMGSAVVCGLAGALVYRIARSLLRASAADVPGTHRLGPTIAAVASLTVSLGTAWQFESIGPGSALLGVVLGLAPLTTLSRGGLREAILYSLPPLAMGLTYDLLFGAASLLTWLSALAFIAFTTPGAGARAPRGYFGDGLGGVVAAVGVAVVGGGVPPALASTLRSGSPFALSAQAPVARVAVDPVAYAHEQLGWLALVLAAGGLVIAMVHARARAVAIALALAAVFGFFGLKRGISGPLPLFALAALAALMAVAMQALVLAVYTAKIPFAAASAAMIVLLELTFPVVNLDESSLRCADKARAARIAWEEEVTGALPSGAIVLISDPSLVRHFTRARALGEHRGDVAIVGLGELRGSTARHLLQLEPKLASLYRDIALRGTPSEPSLVELADARPVAVVFERGWDQGLSRHLVPAGAFDLFLPEPRGTPDRRKGIDAFVPTRDRLAKTVIDPELRQRTASLLRARATALEVARERDLLPRVQDEVKTFEGQIASK